MPVRPEGNPETVQCKALKTSSQNFLFDQNLLSKIDARWGILLSFILRLGKIVAVGSPPSSDKAVIEIGPAAGI